MDVLGKLHQIAADNEAVYIETEAAKQAKRIRAPDTRDRSGRVDTRSRSHGGDGRRGPDPRSRINGGPGRPGRPNSQGRKGKAIGLLEPFTGGRGDQAVVLVYAAEPGEVAAVSSTGDHLGGSGKAGVRKFWQTASGEGWAVYSMVGGAATPASDGNRAGWETHRTNGRPSRFVTPEGMSVWTLARFFRSRCDREVATEALEFWRAIDVPPRGMITMAKTYLRSTLTEPVTTYGLSGRWESHELHREMAYPARQGGWTGTYHDMAYDDISAAYAHALGGESFPSHLSLSDRPGTAPVAAEATVTLPEVAWGPLPVWQTSGRQAGERAVCYGHGTTTGWWSWRELRMATDAGATVERFHRFLRGDLGPQISFGAWLDQALALRADLSGPAGALAKAMSSMTWAAFAMTDRRSHIKRFVGKAQPEIVMSSSRLPGIAVAYVANECHARVRQQLFVDGIGPDTVYADTDGVIRSVSATPSPGWVRKHDMATVAIAAAQWYRWTDGIQPADRSMRWCMSGIPDDVEVADLETLWDETMPEPGQALAGSLPWSGELMAPGDVSTTHETARPRDWRGECDGCAITVTPGTAYPLQGATYCEQCVQAGDGMLLDYQPRTEAF